MMDWSVWVAWFTKHDNTTEWVWTSITTQLANLCENTGYWVRNGQMARSLRVAERVG